MFRLILTLLFSMTYSVYGYNLEARLPLYKRGPDGSTFGFSLTMHKTSSEPQDLAKSLLVIGSPTASALPSQGNTKKPGGIFTCPVTTTPSDCTRVQMDDGDSMKDNNKTGQWLGVSVKSQGAGKAVVTCAHRYSRASLTGANEIERICGKCFLLNGTESNQLRWITPTEAGDRFTASPCDVVGKQNSDLLDYKTTLGYAQHGVSIAVNDDEYLSGAPGTWSWAGAMFDFPILDSPSLMDAFTQTATNMFSTPGCNPDEYFKRRANKAKCDNIPLRRDSYMGFSVAISNAMIKGSSERTYIAGAPRGNYTGAIVMYRKPAGSPEGTVPMIPMLNDIIMGEFIGSSFGFSVATTDLNNDGLDDLIVGAPQYYQYNNDGKYGGAVYVYINAGEELFRKVTPQKLYGPLDSFFGYSVAPIGDIDQDGFNDFAVGAPHEKPSGKIYIYRGSASGVVKKSQTLNGEDFTGVTQNITGFGTSLSGQVDIDNNRYPDLLAGTLADHAILFRSRPIISVASSLEVSVTMIDLKDPNCTFRNKTYSCFDIRFCFNYTARHEEYSETVGIRYTLTFDSEVQGKGRESRVHFGIPNGPSTMQRVANLTAAGEQVCPGLFSRIYFSENAKDRLSPVKVDFRFELASDKVEVKPETPGDPVFQMINDPILNPDYPNSRTVIVTLANTCGDDGCQSDLKANGSLPAEVIVGIENQIVLKLFVSNDGEEAHQAYVTAKLPSGVYYEGYAITESSGAKIECYTSETGDTTFVTCSLGNPYITGSKDTIEIMLDVSQLGIDTKQVLVEVAPSTTSQNLDLTPVVVSANVIVHMAISVTSYGQPQQVRYTNAPIIGESAIDFTNEIGPLLEYTFNVKNEGVQLANGIKLNIEVPIEISNGKWLLYLVSTKVLAGGNQVAGECSETNINPLSINLPVVSSRTKRQTNSESKLYQPRVSASITGGPSRSSVTLDCGRKNARCVTVDCTLEELTPGSTTSVLIKARLWNNTFLEEFRKMDLVKVRTSGLLSSAYSNVRITGNTSTSMIETTVDHAFFKEDSITVFPWWYILIAILAALLIYIIIIYLLIKCGFFKRKRYPVEEKQPEDRVVLVDEDEKFREFEESSA